MNNDPVVVPRYLIVSDTVHPFPAPSQRSILSKVFWQPDNCTPRWVRSLHRPYIDSTVVVYSRWATGEGGELWERKASYRCGRWDRGEEGEEGELTGGGGELQQAPGKEGELNVGKVSYSWVGKLIKPVRMYLPSPHTCVLLTSLIVIVVNTHKFTVALSGLLPELWWYKRQLPPALKTEWPIIPLSKLTHQTTHRMSSSVW